MKTLFVVLAIALVIALGVLLYRWSHSANRLNVEPHASHEIEKAKHR